MRVNIPAEYRQLTLIAWLSSQNLANDHDSILLSDGWKKKGELHWQFVKSGQVQLCVFGQLYPGESTQAVAADCLKRWCMVAGTIDAAADSHRLYLNGEFFDEIKSSRMPLVNIGSATIGGWDNQGRGDSESGKVCNLSGRIDELMIFQKVLTPDEIKQIYETGKP